MPIELEIKLRVESHEPVRRRLLELGADSQGRRMERNTFLDTPEGSLRKADCGLRLRETRKLPDGPLRSILTWKGPRLPGEMKRRDEREVGVDDPAAALNLLASLGFQPTLSFEKLRESWRCEGVLVELDTLPHLGAFVELEGPDEATISRVRGQIGLENARIEPDSYISMMWKLPESARIGQLIPLDPP
jgi:adenylate cyclase class 2